MTNDIESEFQLHTRITDPNEEEKKPNGSAVVLCLWYNTYDHYLYRLLYHICIDLFSLKRTPEISRLVVQLLSVRKYSRRTPLQLHYQH